MSGLDEFSREWLAWIWPATWQLTLLICLIGVVCLLTRKAPAGLRHALWILVLVKVCLPPGLATPVSVGSWGVAPVLSASGLSNEGIEMLPLFLDTTAEPNPGSASSGQSGSSLADFALSQTVLLAIWGAGFLLFWMFVAVRCGQLTRMMRSAVAVDEGPLCVALEQIALRLKIQRVPELFTVETATSPFLYGLFRPRIVMPAALPGALGEAELRAVLAHELVHWRHRDTWVGWWQVLAQSVFWFHPFLWWANRQLRHERECVCDEAVLRLGQIAPEHYGESIVRVLTAARARSLAAGSLVGVFEHGSKLQNRLEDIMSFKPSNREFRRLNWVAIALFAGLFLPMAPGAGETGVVQAQEQKKDAAKVPARTNYPQIVETNPKRGATNVDPALKEITVTFDRDMDTTAMSWTGEKLPIDKSRKPRWIDARTCALPVTLQKGAFYRAGINSTGFKNFKTSDGVAAPPSVMYFTTAGATKSIEEKARVPAIIKLEPENGAMDVDPVTPSLRVTFDIPMGKGMSWTGGGDSYPKSPEGKTGGWSNDGMTYTLPVSLEPNHDYQLGLNSLSFNNFQSESGVPLEPVVYKFRTRAK